MVIAEWDHLTARESAVLAVGETRFWAGHQAWQLMADEWEVPEQSWPSGDGLHPYSELLFSFCQRIPSHRLVSGREKGCSRDEEPWACVGLCTFIYDFPQKGSGLVWGYAFAFVFTSSLQAWLGGLLTCWPPSP